MTLNSVPMNAVRNMISIDSSSTPAFKDENKMDSTGSLHSESKGHLGFGQTGLGQTGLGLGGFEAKANELKIGAQDKMTPSRFILSEGEMPQTNTLNQPISNQPPFHQTNTLSPTQAKALPSGLPSDLLLGLPSGIPSGTASGE